MKKIILFSLLLILATTTFSQQNNPAPTLTKQDYLAKSKKQKTGAWIMLGGGATLILLGDLIGNSSEASFGEAGTGVVMAGVGVLSMLGSIPLFIASKRNKNKGMSLSFGNQKIPSFQKNSFAYQSTPSLKLKISF